MIRIYSTEFITIKVFTQVISIYVYLYIYVYMGIFKWCTAMENWVMTYHKVNTVKPSRRIRWAVHTEMVFQDNIAGEISCSTV